MTRARRQDLRRATVDPLTSLALNSSDLLRLNFQLPSPGTDVKRLERVWRVSLVGEQGSVVPPYVAERLPTAFA